MTESQPCVLVVDDEPVNLLVVVEHFDDFEQNFTVETVDSGEQALACLTAQPERFDLVLLDLMMPGMDGMEVLAQMRQHPVLQRIPVILQTACAREEEIMQGMRAGAYYYLTKPFDEEAFRSVVFAAMGFRMQSQHLMVVLARRDCAMTLLESGRFRLRTLQQADTLSVRLACLCERPDDALVGFYALLVNAIEHGNLNIGYATKTALNADRAWASEVARRLALPENQAKAVIVDVKRSGGQLEVLIQDQGQGFEWGQYLTLSVGRMHDNHGRGIVMAKMFSFQEMTYLGCGNAVRVLVEEKSVL